MKYRLGMASPQKNPAFTLVELLTVIAIIGILAALLLAAIAEAKAGALDQGKGGGWAQTTHLPTG